MVVYQASRSIVGAHGYCVYLHILLDPMPGGSQPNPEKMYIWIYFILYILPCIFYNENLLYIMLQF